MSKHPPMKQQAFDATNGTIAVSYVAATLNGWTVQEWAAFLAGLYSAVLLVDKFFPAILPWLRGALMSGVSAVWSRVVRRG